MSLTRLILYIGVPLATGFCLCFLIIKGCRDNPQVITGSETTLVSVIVHDTIVTRQKATAITTSRMMFYDTIPVIDTVRRDTLLSVKADSTQCFSVEETETDGAFIRAKICSDSFPLVKPEDVSGEIMYVAAPDSLREILRTDTITASTKGLFLKSLSWFGVGILGGIVAVALLWGNK
jgi:hypothetical protein